MGAEGTKLNLLLYESSLSVHNQKCAKETKHYSRFVFDEGVTKWLKKKVDSSEYSLVKAS